MYTCEDRILSVEWSYTFREMIVYLYHNRILYVRPCQRCFVMCFQYMYVPKWNWCFQYAEYVSNLIRMFPIYYPTYSVSNIECMFVHYTIFVSKCRWIIWDHVSNVCFQYTILFSYKTIFLSIFWKLLFIISAVRALRG